MKKQYIAPEILGHKIVTPSLLQASTQTPAAFRLTPNNNNNNINSGTAQSKGSTSLFDDEPVEKNDFAYGL